MMLNLVAPLEMALHDGVHPLLGEAVGPRTGDAAALASFADFRAAYETQLGWLIDRSVECNDLLGRAHQHQKPTPLLSALIAGPMEQGRDLIEGGARYNSHGIALVGLTDVVDSLCAVKTLVFERRRVSLATLLEALRPTSSGTRRCSPRSSTRCRSSGRTRRLRAPSPTGSSTSPTTASPRTRATAAAATSRLLEHVEPRRLRHPLGRAPVGAPPRPALHAGADARARLRRDSHAADPLRGGPRPGQAPQQHRLQLQARPRRRGAGRGGRPHGRLRGRVLRAGGMQIQFNVVSTETLKDAMARPDEYRDLLVRISGYNAYFVELNRDMPARARRAHRARALGPRAT